MKIVHTKVPMQTKKSEEMIRINRQIEEAVAESGIEKRRGIHYPAPYHGRHRD